MEFSDSVLKSKKSRQLELAKIQSSRLNETPLGDVLASNGNENDNAEIDLSGDPNQMPPECDLNFEDKSNALGHEIFDDLDKLANPIKKKSKQSNE